MQYPLIVNSHSVFRADNSGRALVGPIGVLRLIDVNRTDPGYIAVTLHYYCRLVTSPPSRSHVLKSMSLHVDDHVLLAAKATSRERVYY